MMKRYILPSLLILALAGGLAFAQSITKALQLSQDASGAFGVDTTNNVYFPGHVLTTGRAGPAPALSACITGGSPTLVGTDVAGTITGGTTASTKVIPGLVRHASSASDKVWRSSQRRSFSRKKSP